MRATGLSPLMCVSAERVGLEDSKHANQKNRRYDAVKTGKEDLIKGFEVGGELHSRTIVPR
jgi:hypothetical protein